MNPANAATILSHLLSGRCLEPGIQVSDIAELVARNLVPERVEGIIFDVDNTLTRHRGAEIHPAVSESFEKLCARYRCAILSNCGETRAAQLRAMFSLPVLRPKRRKPDPEGFRLACQTLRSSADRILMIGDRILTDILGANLCGHPSVLVDPLDPKSDPPWIRWARTCERRRIGIRRCSELQLDE